MHLPRRITADGVAAVLLVSAAVLLVATPYDGGSCRNVASAYALPAASLEPAQPPTEPAALNDAREAVSTAQSEVTALAAKQADVDALQQAAEQARAAADKAAADQYSDTSSIDGDLAVTQAQGDVDLAESEVSSDQSMLTSEQQDAASYPDDPTWNQMVQDDQATLDAAKAKLGQARQALQKAQNQASASAAAVNARQHNADKLSADADAARKAADAAAGDLATQQSSAEEGLSAAESEEARQESAFTATVADWSHSRRLAADHVTALNNVRSSCRQTGTLRASVAGSDLVLLAAVAALHWAPGLRRLRTRVLPLPRLLRRRRP